MLPTTSTKGVLRPDAATREVDLQRYPASPGTATYLERCWSVTWDLAEPYVMELVPHPCSNITIGPPQGAFAHGVGTRKSQHPLSGKGWIFGAKFRPGGLAALLGIDASTVTDRTVPMRELFGPDTAELAHAVLAAPAHAQRVSLVEQYLLTKIPAPDPAYHDVVRAVTLMLHDRTVVRAEDAAQQLGITLRSLQRLFRRYIGVPPKWVIRRYRMHDAAERLASDPNASASQVAVELGWFDQAHFAKEFRDLVGLSPLEYANACARDQDHEPLVLHRRKVG